MKILETTKEKKIREFEYDFRPTGFPWLDAINGLIKLADRYAKEGNLEKSKELSDKIEKALDEIRNETIGTTLN